MKWLVGSLFEGKGSLVLIEGEIGIGKTRLVEEIHRWVDEDEGRKLSFLGSRCLYYGSCDPYLPFLDALKGYNRGISGAGGMPQLLPGENAIVGADEGDADPSSLSQNVRPTIIDLRHLKDERDRMFENVTDVVIGISKEKPLILFIDDLHWADNPSLQLLQYLAQSTKDAGVLIIGAYRPEELRKAREEPHPLSEIMHNMKRENLFTKIELGRFDKHYIGQMIHSIFGHSNVPEEFVEQIYEITEGNPFFVEEILRSFIEERIVDLTDALWYEHIDTSRISVPETIRDVVIRRMKRLDKDSLKILRYAALIGRVFEYNVLFWVSGMEEEKLLDAIEELINAKLIHEDLDSEEEKYRFDNTIISEVAYGDLSRSRRRVIHRKVAEALEELFSQDTGPVIYDLARHFFRGKSYSKAVHYLMRAGEMAESLYAVEEAQNYYHMALEAMGHLADDLENEKQRVIITGRLGLLHQIIGNWQKAVEYHERTIVLLNEAEEELRRASPAAMEFREFADAPLDERWLAVRMAESYRNLGNIKRFQAAYEEAEDCYKHAIAISREIEDHFGIAEANRGMGYIHWRRGEYDKAISHYDRTMQEMERSEDKSAMGIVSIELGNVYNSVGDWVKAIEYYERAIRELERSENLREMARAYNNLGDIFIQREEWDKAIMYFSRSESTAEKAGNRYMMGWTSFNQAECYANLGELERALEKNDNAFKCLSPLDDKVGLSAIHRNYGTIYRFMEKWELSVENFEKSTSILVELDIPFELGYSYYEFGLMYRDKGDMERAKEYVGKALECFEKVGAKKRIEIIESEWDAF